MNRRADAAEAYRRALELATNPTERAYLERRLAELAGSWPSRAEFRPAHESSRKNFS